MIALIVLGSLAAYAGINYLAWYSTAASVQRMSLSEARPWNWRVLAGPFAYYPWLNRQERIKELEASPPPSLLVLDDSWPPRRVGDRRG